MDSLTQTTEQPRERPRAVFSNQDFKLIRTAIQHYLQEIKDEPESIKYASLYHRLGRLGS